MNKEHVQRSELTYSPQSYFRPETYGWTYFETAKQLCLHDRAAFHAEVYQNYKGVLCWLTMLMSFVTDSQNSDSRDLEHTWNFNHYDDTLYTDLECIDPLVGTWAPILPTITRLGKVLQNHKLEIWNSPGPISELLKIESSLLQWQSDSDPCWNRTAEPGPQLEPFVAEIHDSVEVDGLPTDLHFTAMAHSYRLAGLLDLYRGIPMICFQRLSVIHGYSVTEKILQDFLQSLANTILRLLRTIPTKSRLFRVGTYPLITSGQFCVDEMDREWIQGVFKEVRTQTRVPAVTKICDVLREVWRLRDGGTFVSWRDVFSEWKLVMLMN